MPADTATGVEKDTVCQPEADSLVKVAVARSWPLDDQRFPMWVPVFAAAL